MRVRSARDVGALVRDARKQAGLSQEALAERVGVSRRWIVALESGKPGAELGLVLRVLADLGLTLRADRSKTVTGADLNDILARWPIDAD